MTEYRTVIHNSKYTEWDFIPIDKSIQNIPIINPLEHKLFTKDIILYDHTTEIVKKIHSEVRTGIAYAGILLLEQNKTFGRNNNNKRLLYKCIPDDNHLPAFLIPYEIKLGFQKKLKNKFVVFKYDHWNEQHPHGILVETLGDIDQLPIFYEYQLYCKSLHISITDFTNKTREQLKKRPEEEYIQQMIENPHFHIEDRRTTEPLIFSIDPVTSSDFDDAFSIQYNHETQQYKVSVYIANVYLWLETLQLWKSFSNRVSTIYLPDRKRPMLPTILSDSLCSLQEGHTRFAFVIDFHIGVIENGSHPIVQKIDYHHVAIKVHRNYRYEEHKLLYDNPQYNLLFELTKKFDKNVTDSHDVVSHWMIKMNSYCGEYLAEKQIGIFRKANITKSLNIKDQLSNLDSDTKRVIEMWNNISGQYILYDKDLEIHHDIMKIKNYIHITSPIRRLVDLLNQFKMSVSLGLIENHSKDAELFLEKWMENIEHLNVSMRSIRKIQTDCEVLHRFYTDSTIMFNTYSGVVFDKVQKNDHSFVYMVYLKELRLLSRFKTYHHEFENYTSHNFKLYLFEQEHSMKKKIRVQIVL